jgi:hypothetical protein
MKKRKGFQPKMMRDDELHRETTAVEKPSAPRFQMKHPARSVKRLKRHIRRKHRG